MYYIIQENVFRESNYNKIFDTLNKLDLPFEVINCSPPETDIKFNTDRKDIFVFGSIRLAKLSRQYQWSPGSFFGDNHDYSIYSKYYKDNLLNYDCKIMKLSEDITWDYGETKFIRPCKDSKAFNGQVFTQTKWEDLAEREKYNEYSIWSDNLLIQVGSIKTIYKEARVWIVAGKVVTSSYYRFGPYVEWSENVEPEGLEFAQKMVDEYQVAEAFVMDICLTPDGWKIVEINCINCAGFYEGDLQKLVIALEDHFNPAQQIILEEDNKENYDGTNTEDEGILSKIFSVYLNIFRVPLIPIYGIFIVYYVNKIIKETGVVDITLMTDKERENHINEIIEIKMEELFHVFTGIGIVIWYFIIKFLLNLIN